jgi:hypothetical protein
MLKVETLRGPASEEGGISTRLILWHFRDRNLQKHEAHRSMVIGW